MNNKVVIIGLGNIGRRHLQGVSNARSCDEILGYDANPNAITETEKFISKNKINRIPTHFIKEEDDVLAGIDGQTVVIMAATAKGRHERFRNVLKRRPKGVIVEKPLCQTEKEYAEILSLSKESSTPVYINFHRHLYKEYQGIFAHIQDTKLRSIYATTWGGMACNGIHIFEVMTWMAQAKEYEILYMSKPKVYESKRKGFFDFEGEIVFMLNKNIICTITARDAQTIETYDIVAEDRQYFINESVKKMIVTDKWKNQKEVPMDVLYISQLSGDVVSSLFKGEQYVKLPRIEQTYLAHKILFDYIDKEKISGINFT